MTDTPETLADEMIRLMRSYIRAQYGMNYDKDIAMNAIRTRIQEIETELAELREFKVTAGQEGRMGQSV